MTVSYLTKTELGHEDGVKHLDPDVKNALLNALYVDGIYNPGKPDDGTKAWFQDDGNHFPGVSPITQILELDQNAQTVDTNPYLKAIIMDDAGGPHGDGNARQLDVTDGTPNAHNSIFVAMGNAGDTLTLHDSGNDTVYGGKGNDLIDARHNTGNDSLVGGGGNDTIWGGVGHDTLIGGTGRDELHSGSVSGGPANILYGGGGADTLYGGGGADSLYGGTGADTLIAGSGSHQLLQGNGGNDTFWLLDTSGANSTLQGGAGKDTFHIDTKVGNDTIIGGGGKDVVDFNRSIMELNPGDGIKVDGNGYTISFTDGHQITQQIHVSGISELHFTDQNVKL
jgi:Ca2+-binding RTX toxin-like protein